MAGHPTITDRGAASASIVTPTQARSIVSWGYLAAAVGVAALVRTIPGGPVALVDVLVIVASLVALTVGLRWHRPERGHLWGWLIGALTLYAAAGVVYDMGSGATGKLLALAVHGVGWAALVRLLVRAVRERDPSGDRDGLIDSLIATVSVAVTAWVLVFEPVLAAEHLPMIERTTVVAYPLLGVFTLPFVIRLLVTGGRSVPALRMLLMALIGATVADTLFAFLTWAGGSQAIAYAFYPVNFALAGAAGLHPSMVRITNPGRAPTGPVTALRFGLLGATALVPPALLWLPWLRGAGLAVPVISLGSITIFGLVSMRMWRLVRAVEQLTTRRGEQRFRSLVHNADDVIAILDRDLRVRFITPSVERWGHDVDAVVGRHIDDFVDPDDVARWRALPSSGHDGGLPRFHGRVRAAGDEWREVEAAVADLTDDPDVGGIVLTLHDVTDRNHLQRELAHRAEHDHLTGLPNRSLFHAAVDRVGDSRGTRGVALLFLDVDDFKGFNDSLGHAAGDELLTVLAHACATRCVMPTCRPGWAATSSPSCCRGATPSRPGPWPRACSLPSRRRSPSRTATSWSTPAWGWPSGPTGSTPTSCCATPTSPCTRRRSTARTASRSSTPSCCATCCGDSRSPLRCPTRSPADSSASSTSRSCDPMGTSWRPRRSCGGIIPSSAPSRPFGSSRSPRTRG